MQYKLTPPKTWLEKETSIQNFNLYQKILKNYKDSEIVFKVIKEDQSIVKISKFELIKKTTSLVNQIEFITQERDDANQLKMMAIIGASEESVIFMLSSIYLGAHHCICFEDLSDEAIYQRINIFNPHIILCRSKLELKLNNIKVKYKLNDLKLHVIDLSSLIGDKSNIKTRLAKSYKYKSKLFTLFTSGSTGLPKAIVHGGGDFINYAEFTTKYYFGIGKEKTMFSAVDAGWINGHTYSFYGPLLLGGKSIINEYPLLITMPNLIGKYFEELKPDCFYTSVTLLRLIKSVTPKNKNIYDFFREKNKYFAIDRIGSCGEPLAHSVGEWSIKFFQPKRKTIVNTYFQTETGGILVAPRDEDNLPNDYSCVGKPSKEIKIVLANQIKNEKELKNEKLHPNELLICNRWDGVFNEVISDRSMDYFTKTGEYRLHDVGYFDEKGNLFIGGRSDDVINVSGHRISSSEVENISMTLERINEACAVAVKDELAGSKVILFFSSTNVQKEEILKIKSNLNNLIFKKLTKYHVPKEIYYFKCFPKTKSGKIMRRIMRSLVERNFDQNKDYSTISNKDDFFISKNSFFKEYK